MKKQYLKILTKHCLHNDFSGTSGNLQTDNNAVTFLSTATQKEAEVEAEEAPIEQQEKQQLWKIYNLKIL